MDQGKPEKSPRFALKAGDKIENEIKLSRQYK